MYIYIYNHHAPTNKTLPHGGHRFSVGSLAILERVALIGIEISSFLGVHWVVHDELNLFRFWQDLGDFFGAYYKGFPRNLAKWNPKLCWIHPTSAFRKSSCESCFWVTCSYFQKSTTITWPAAMYKRSCTNGATWASWSYSCRKRSEELCMWDSGWMPLIQNLWHWNNFWNSQSKWNFTDAIIYSKCVFATTRVILYNLNRWNYHERQCWIML